MSFLHFSVPFIFGFFLCLTHIIFWGGGWAWATWAQQWMSESKPSCLDVCISQVTEALMASFQRFGTWEVSASHLGKEPFAKSWKKSFLPKKLKAGLVDLVKDRSDIFAIALPNETYICCPPSAHPSISFKWVCLWKRWISPSTRWTQSWRGWWIPLRFCVLTVIPPRWWNQMQCQDMPSGLWWFVQEIGKVLTQT